MLAKIAGRVRGLFPGNYPENREDEQAHLTNRGDLIVTQGLPELTEIVRLGETWQALSSTPAAALTALPTTTPQLGIYNGEPANGKSYIIDSVAAFEVVIDGSTGYMTGLFACNNKTPVAQTFTAVATTVASMSGRTYGGKVKVITASSTTITNDGWFPVGTSAPVSSTPAGGGWKQVDVPLKGLYIVPPGGCFSVAAVKIAAAASQMQYVIRWHEAQIIYKS